MQGCLTLHLSFLVSVLWFVHVHDGDTALKLLPIQGDQMFIQLVRRCDIYHVTASDSTVGSNGNSSIYCTCANSEF